MKYDEEDLDTMARTIWGEARGEGLTGRDAVGWVIANRAARHWAGDLLGKDGAIKAVCIQANQFSCWNTDDPNLPKLKALADDDLDIYKDQAVDILEGVTLDPTNGADHYFADTIQPPSWSKAFKQTAHIGHHIFFDSTAPSLARPVPVPVTPPPAEHAVAHDQLTKNFTLSEFLNSQTARDFNIQNIPDGQAILNIHSLTEQVLQPMRDLLGHPVEITSGFRVPALNKAVGGEPNSDHMIGCAADFRCEKFGSPKEIVEFLSDKKLPFKKLIFEHPYGEGTAWVHISWAPGEPLRKVLQCTSPGVYTDFKEE